MGDLTSTRLIVAKGLLFLATALLSSALLVAEHPTTKVVMLLAVAVWASARFYYFTFYVIGRYVAPGTNVSGLWSAVRHLWKTRDAVADRGESGAASR